MKLAYHRGDSAYPLKDYVYLWNLLEEVTMLPEVVKDVEILSDTSPYVELTKKWKYLSSKGLRTPRDEFGRGGSRLDTTLFLKGDDGGIRYYWHGRASVEKTLQDILKTKGGNLTKHL